MTDEPRGEDHGGASAPWERPRRWNQNPLDQTRVDDLLARLGTTPSGGRRRRRETEEETETVSASELIAALAPETLPSSDAPQPAEHPEPEQPATADGPARSSQPAEPPAGEPVAEGAPDLATPAPDPATPSTTTTGPAEPGPGAAPRTAWTDAAEASQAPQQPTAAERPASPEPPDADDRTVLLTHGGAPDDDDRTVLLAPIAARSDDHTEVIPRITAAEPDEAASIRARLADATSAGAETTTIAAPPARRTPHRKLMVAGRTAVAVLTAITLFITGWYWTILERTESGLADRHMDNVLNTTDPNIVAPTVKPSTAPAGVTLYPPLNILLIGSDTRAGSNGNAGNSDASTEDSANSDTMMIAHLSADRQHVTILSLPRDTVIPAPQCKNWDFRTGKLSTEDYPVEVGVPSHLNSSFSMGGPTCVVKAVQAMTGIRIDKYIGIDFAGFKAMVDAVGGIDITTCGPIKDGELGVITDHGGPQVFKGEAALSLVRARSVAGESGADLARIKRQQAVLSALLRQVSSAGTLANPVKLDNFLQAFVHNTFNDGVTLENLLDIAGSLGDLNPDTVTFYTLPTYPSERVQYALEIDQPKAQAIFQSIINDVPLPGQKVGAAATTTAKPTTKSSPTTTAAPDLTLTVAPADVPLKIYNVAGESGVAGKTQQALNEIGFKVTEDDLIRPDDDIRKAVTVEYAPAQRAAALTVAAAVPGATLVVNASLGDEVRLMVGSDFDGTVKAVKVGQKAPASLTAVATTTGSGSGDSGSGDTTADQTRTPTPATTLKPSDLPGYNAADTNCVGPRPNSS